MAPRTRTQHPTKWKAPCCSWRSSTCNETVKETFTWQVLPQHLASARSLAALAEDGAISHLHTKGQLTEDSGKRNAGYPTTCIFGLQSSENLAQKPHSSPGLKFRCEITLLALHATNTYVLISLYHDYQKEDLALYLQPPVTFILQMLFGKCRYQCFLMSQLSNFLNCLFECMNKTILRKRGLNIPSG